MRPASNLLLSIIFCYSSTMKLPTQIKDMVTGFKSDANQRFIPTLMALSALAVGLLISIGVAAIVGNYSHKDFVSQEYEQTNTIVRYKTNNMEAYEQLLVFASTIYYTHNNQITQKDWSDLYSKASKLTKYDSLVGIGYSDKITPDELATLSARLAEAGATNPTLRPANPSGLITPIVLIEPRNDDNLNVLGFDMSTESSRAEAMLEAAKTDQAVLTRPVKLAQDFDSSQQRPGLIMYYPLYTNVDVPESADERMKQLEGFVYVVFRPHDLISTALSGTNTDGISFLSLTDITEATPQTIYSYSNSHVHGNPISITRLFDVGTRTWQVKLAATDNSRFGRYGPRTVLAIGSFISLLLAALLYALLAHRLHKIEAYHRAMLQKSKDEMLAIASHQLRTPASGVKQYIGMLLQGFTGALTDEQRAITAKAYAANERQLEIINQLLYVAKADAGQIFIDYEELDINEVISHSLGDITQRADEKNIRIKRSGTRPLPAILDKTFTGMVIENLLTNAIKYSYPDSVVTIRLKRVNSTAVITVADKGVGIAKEEYESLFEKFSRVDNPLSRSEGGSGLGLFLVKRLVEAQHGTIDVTSRVGKGSTFTVTLPIRPRKKTKPVLLS